MAKTRANPVDEPPLLRKGYKVELNSKYFSHHNGADAPFARGVAYKILEVVDNIKGYERTDHTNESVYKRRAVIALDKDGKARKIDESFLAKPGWWNEHKDDPEEAPAIPEVQASPAEDAPAPGDGTDSLPGPQEDAFGQLLRKYREAAGLQQKDLAERLGIRSRAYISMLENGSRRIYMGSGIRKLADALGLDDADREILYAAGGYRAEEEVLLDNGFNTVLKRHRSRVMSQDELSEAIGLSRSYIAHLEVGSKTPSINATIRIADALKLEGDERREFFLLAGYGGAENLAQHPGESGAFGEARNNTG